MAERAAEPDVTIRAAKPQEFGAIATMHLQAWKKAYEAMIKPECLAQYNVSTFVSHYETLIADAYTLTVAEADAEIVGMAIVHPDRGEIDPLYVVREKWHGGIGTRLLCHVLDAMQSPEIVLECAQGNERGCRFWEQRGFVQSGDGDGFDPHCDDRIPTWRYVRSRSTATSAEPQQATPTVS